MTIVKRSMLVATTTVLAIAAALPLRAQDPAARKPAEAQDRPSPVVKKVEPSARVPDYFGQIGLTPEQRAEVYKVRKTHRERIDALKQQIAEAEAKSLAECEAVLTDTQKKLLENLRNGSVRTAKRAEPAKAPK